MPTNLLSHPKCWSASSEGISRTATFKSPTGVKC
jgi:hypothetical protein